MLTEQDFKNKYNVKKLNLTICGKKFQFFLPRSIETFIDSQNPMNNFPLWAKVWPSSMVLADYVASRPVEKDKQILEIGGGIGIVGIAAAAFGHNIVISEGNKHALEFARANAFINGKADIPVVFIDWNQPGLNGRFDQIIGSEIVFRNEDFAPLKNLFKSHLKPGGEIILTSEIRGTVIEFFRNMEVMYTLEAQQKTISSKEEKTKIIFCRMTPKS